MYTGSTGADAAASGTGAGTDCGAAIVNVVIGCGKAVAGSFRTSVFPTFSAAASMAAPPTVRRRRRVVVRDNAFSSNGLKATVSSL